MCDHATSKYFMDDVFKSISHHIDVLKDPYLVVKVQNFFGVYSIDDVNDHKRRKQQNHQTANADKKSLPNGLHHRAKPMDVSDKEYAKTKLACSSDGEELQSDDVDSDTESSIPCRIENLFWYYTFLFGAALGYELFYASFFPFWYWNVDGAVCRRVIITWALVMYCGQASKELIRWSRPKSPPVVQLEPDYSAEYGMPSTHAMTAVAVPFSILVFTMHRYEYPFIIGLLISTVWCVLVCTSRLYLGMHTVLDIIGGLIFSTVLMFIFVPLADTIDNFALTHPYAPIAVIGATIFLAVIFPQGDHWNPARGDTCIIISTGAGVHFGAWLSYQYGYIQGPGLPPPYQIVWPGYVVIGLALLRACIGILAIVASRAVFKSLTYAMLCYWLRVDPNDINTRRKVLVEIPSKFITYLVIGFTITYLSPAVFRFLNIDRITVYTEV